MPARTLAGAVLFVLLFGGCRDSLSPDQRALDAAERQWNRARPASNSYTMQQQVLCFCITRGIFYNVTVTRGVVNRAVNPETGAEFSAEMLTMFRTIDELFAAARDAAATPGQLTALEFDVAAGYPSVLGLDPIKQAADDEVVYRTQRLVPLP